MMGFITNNVQMSNYLDASSLLKARGRDGTENSNIYIYIYNLIIIIKSVVRDMKWRNDEK